MNSFETTFEYKLIYVFRINDKAHEGLLKIGEATCHTDKNPDELVPNCNVLNVAAKKRINQYTTTAGIVYELLYTELARHMVIKKGKNRLEAFSDHDVHKVLERTGIKRHYFDAQNKANEWFKVDLETAKKAINAVKEGRSSLLSSEVSEGKSPIIFRPEQADAIRKTIKQFKTGNQMLWNAKMRFGKTLTALQVAKECEFKHVLILTHRPVVSDGWYDDFEKIFYDTDYVFGSKKKGEDINNLIDTDKKFVYFVSLQDLRGSEAVGGKYNKNDEIFLTEWDFVVIDEAHEGTLTKLGKAVIETIKKLSNNPKILRLSGTPFNIVNQFTEEEIYTWDYVMEQREKRDWDKKHFGDPNPYATLPKLEIFTYDLDKLIPGYLDAVDKSFNFREFFRTWTGNVQKDFKPIPEGAQVGEFVHKASVKRFLDLLCRADSKSNYPFSTQEYREYFRHSLWIVPGVKEASALSAMLNKHSVFGSGVFKIVNVAGDGDEEIDPRDALKAVRNAFGDNPDETYSITLSCGRLTTGVTVPEWTAVFMLAGSYSTSASSYLQTIFRVQSPANINGKVKERCCVFDFAPDRTLKVIAEASNLSVRTGNISNNRFVMGELLNFCPVISMVGSSMQPYNVDRLLQQLKKVYVERVVSSGFEDRHLYNEALFNLNELDFAVLNKVKKIVSASKPTEKPKNINLAKNNLNNEDYKEIKRIEAKPKKERTPEEIALLEEQKKKIDNAQKAMSILRGISIRIPLLIYGADVPFDQEITASNFVDLIDDSSWNEFMPEKFTKDIYKEIEKYYEQDVFVASGRRIRDLARAADELIIEERVKNIAALFAKFKNPDKETVLTPWRVVNMHMSDCLGGYCFYNEDFTDTIEEPRYVDRGKVTEETLANTKAQILEINSKTGLYPLYVTYSIYRKRCKEVKPEDLTIEKQYELWQKTVEDNIFVICKTPMAKAITRRTLLGYRKGKINAHAFDDLIMQLKEKPEQFREKVLRGSFWNKENKEMKFDAVVGNPPYQLDVGIKKDNYGLPIYNDFVVQSIKLAPKYLSMITPSRWFTGGRGLEEYRRKMLNDKHIKKLVDFVDSKDCFPGVDVAGGVSYFIWDESYNDKCEFVSIFHNKKSIMFRDLSKYSIFTRYNEALCIIDKVKANSKRFLSEIVSQQTPFGFITTYRGEDKPFTGSVTLLTSAGKTYVAYEKVTRGKEMISKYKVIFSKATCEHAGVADKNGKFRVLSFNSILEPFEICSQSYLVGGCFDTKKEAQNFHKYIKCMFTRFLLMQAVSSQDISREKFMFVPLQDFTENSDIDWSKSVAEIDRQLYKKYNLSDEETSFIESMIKPME